ncbi:MAG: hypothetical protein J6E44_06105 [Lachnospiraceae bacterium]|nr:hypothetical protein [Lachnospiraceae bacterium]
MAEEMRKLSDEQLEEVLGGVLPKYDYLRLLSDDPDRKQGSSGMVAWLTEHLFRRGLEERSRKRNRNM